MNERQKRFCEFYAENPDGTDAAIKAGYSPRTAASIGSENLRKPELLAYIRELQDQAAAPRIASIMEAKAVVSDVLRDPSEATGARLKAAELLLRSSGAFVRVSENESGRVIETGGADGGTVILLPPRQTEEECMVEDDEDDTGLDIPPGWTVIR